MALTRPSRSSRTAVRALLARGGIFSSSRSEHFVPAAGTSSAGRNYKPYTDGVLLWDAR